MKAHDRDALRRAMSIARQEIGRPEELDAKLKDEPWAEVAAFAAHVCQIRSLHLRPWEKPPTSTDVDDAGPPGELLRRTFAAGLSKYEPDPIAALDRRSMP